MGKNRLTKKQLRTDELETALVGARDYVAGHRDETLRWTLIIAAVLLAAFGVRLAIEAHSAKIGARLSQALATYDAPLVTDGSGTAPGQKVYKDAAERAAAAKKELEDLAKDSPSSTAGRAAQVLLISMEGSKGATGTRVDAAKSFVDGENGWVSGGIAAVSLLDAQAAAGRTTEAIETAKKYLSATKSPLPKDVLIFTLAHLYEKAGKPVEAKSYYQRVVSEFPDSPMNFEAKQRSAAL